MCVVCECELKKMGEEEKVNKQSKTPNIYNNPNHLPGRIQVFFTIGVESEFFFQVPKLNSLTACRKKDPLGQVR